MVTSYHFLSFPRSFWLRLQKYVLFFHALVINYPSAAVAGDGRPVHFRVASYCSHP